MSFTDDYLAQKKKKKKYDTGDSFTDEYLNLTGYEISPETDNLAPIKSTSKTEDIAPVKEEKENKWFQSGAFEDGYQFGDIFKTVTGTAKDLSTNIAAGILGIGEKVVDAGATAVGAVGSLFGADEFADKTKEFVKKDLYDEEKLAENLTGSVVTRILGLAGVKKPDYEAQSVLGEKTDSLAQSGGQLLGTIALQTAGVPWWVTSGTTSFGGEAESAFKEDATYGEAVVSGLVTAGAEMLSEKLFGGSGLGETGWLKLDVLTKNISNKAIKLLADYGVDMAAEGVEEIVSQFFGNLGTALYKEESLGEILASEEALEGYLDSFIGGVALGGVANVGKAVNSAATGRDYRTELTESEQSVVDREFKDRLAEKEKEGETLSKKEQADLYDKVIRDMERGYLDTGKIESVVGGDVYRQYEAAKAQEDAILKEFKELGNKKDATLAEQTRYEQLKETVRDIKANSRSEFLKSMMKENIYRKGDRLFESYRERSRRGEAFKVNIANYDEKEKETIQKAIDSGILNNTNRTHEFVDTIAKISADKGVSFDFTDNAKLKESGFAIDGATVNGFVTKDGITLNIDSAKAWESTVGHEITHVLEGTEFYSELQNTLFEYAKSKGEYDTRLSKLKELYKDVEGADVDAELTADLVGDYLFTDEDFINNLSVKNRNVFQKIYDEIKYLLKVVKAGSKEARQLEKVKRAFDKAYKEGGTSNVKGEKDVNYSITEPFVDNDGNRYENAVLLDTDAFDNVSPKNWWRVLKEHLENRVNKSTFIMPVVDENGNTQMLEFAKSNERVSKDGKKSHPALGDLYMTNDNISKLSAIHIDEIVEVSEADAPYYTQSDGHGWLDSKGWLHRTANVINAKNGNIYQITMDIAKAEDGRIILYALNGKTKRVGNAQVNSLVAKTTSGSWQNSNSDGIITQNSEKSIGNAKLSLSDSDGKKLTKEQREYFKDSKMRDEDGNLKVMYHGSQDAGFHVFEGRFSDDGTSFFFVDSNDVAASYSGTSETYEAQTIRTAEDMNNFIESIGVEGYEVIERDGKFTLLYEGDRVADSNTAQGIFDEFRWYEGVGEGDANYKVYLNLTNPLEIDAKGRPWNKIDAEFSQEVYNKYKSLTAEEKAALTDLAEWEDFRIFNSEIQEAADNELASAYAKMGEDSNIYDLFSVAADNFSEESMRENARRYLNTRDFAQRAKEGGYDGVIFKNVIDNGGYSNGSEGASTVAIAFNSEQIKSVANEKPTGDPDIRFSLSETVEETPDLIAAHNLSTDNLLKSLELGGLPMPSVAITRADSVHNDYGNVSLILRKDAIDPKANRENKIYSGDAWTPVYPTIEFKPNDAVTRKIGEKYYELAGKYGYDDVRPLYRFTNDTEDALKRDGGEQGLLNALYDDTSMMQVYLLDKGIGKVETIQEEIRTELSDVEVAQHEFFIKELGADVVDGVMYNGGGSIAMHKKQYWENHGEQIKETYKKLLTEEYGFTDEEVQNVFNSMKTFDFLKLVRDAYVYRKNGRVTVKTEPNKAATEKAIREKAEDGYKEWVDGLFKGIEEKTGIRNNRDYFTPSGNRRSWDALHWENTLENVVRVMKAQGNGENTFFTGHGIWGAAANEYKSIKDVKADSDRLKRLPKEEYEAIRGDIGTRLQDVAQRIMSKTESNQFIAADNALACIVDAVRHSRTADGILRELKQYTQLTVTEADAKDIVSIVADIAKMPTEYFEAKPQRAVGFDEVGVFVIPRNADVKLKQELLNRGYAIAEYDPDIEGDRQKVVNSFEEYKFSLSGVNETPKKYGDRYTPARELRYESAPVREDMTAKISENKNTAAKENAAESEIEDLMPFFAPVAEEEVNALARDSFASLDDADMPPEVEAPYYESADALQLDDKALKNISKRVGDMLGLDSKERIALGDVVQRYSTAEFPSEAELFNEIEEQFGDRVMEYEDERTKEVKRLLKSYKVKVSPTIKGDITNYGSFMRSNFGKIRFSNDGLGVDQVYMELSEIYPDYFPSDIINPTEQLLIMSEVANFSNLSETYHLSEDDIQQVLEVIKSEVGEYKNTAKRKATEADARAFIDDIAPSKAKEIAKEPLNDTAPRYQDINSRLEQDKATLAKEFEQKKAQMQSQLADKNTFISNKAKELYNEIRNLKKGVRASKELGYILDHGHEWKSIKAALINAMNSPGKTVNVNSAAEGVVRELLNEVYESSMYDLSDMDNEYQKQLAKLEAKAEKERSGVQLKTVKERLTEKLASVERELADNKRLQADSIVDFNREIARLQEEYSEKANKNTKVANNILRRIERLQSMKNNVDADYSKRISDLEARREKMSEEIRTGESAAEQGAMRAELHQNKIDAISAKFAEKGLDFDEVLRKAKNLSTFATVDNTPQRVMEKALGYREGRILADETVNKVAQNETEGVKWLNSYTDRKNGLLAQISKQYNIKPGSKESAAAQMYAEGFYVNKNDEIIKYGDTELGMDFPDDKVRKNIKGLARDPRIRQIYDDTLDKINESRARNAYPEILKLDNYFLHFRAMNDTFSRLGLPFNPNDIQAKDLPTDLNGVTADLKPGQPYFASANHRMGMRTSFDLLGGLESYLSSAKNQIYHIDDIQTLRAVRNYVADSFGQAKGLEGLDSLTEEEVQEKIKQVHGAHLSTFAKFLNEEANVIAGKTALIDRGLEGIIGRRGITFLNTVNGQVGANMVGLNVSSSLTNFLAPVQAFAKTNKFAFVKGFTQTVYNRLGSIIGKTDGFADNSPVMIRRKGADRFYRKPFQKAADAGYALMSAVDSISTEIIARAKFNEYTAKGMSAEQAHIETDKWVSRLMGDRSLGQMPQLYNSKMLGLITKFQLEVRNQLDSQFFDTIQEAKADNAEIENALERNSKTAAKVAATFAELAVAQHIFGAVFESIAGYNPAFDIIEVLIKTLGFDDDEESEDTVLDNIEQGFLALLEDLPYTSTLTGGRIPISSALPIKELVTGKDEYGNEKSRLETLGEVAPYYILPGGYGQIKKTVQGLSMFNTDEDHPIAGSYTDSGDLRFPIDDTLKNRVQAGIFGQWASGNAREYFDNDIAPLNEKQINEFIDVDMTIQDYWKYREGLSKYSTLAEKADYINSLDLTVEQKNVLINNIADRKEDIDMSDYDNYGSFEEFDYANKYPEKYEFWKQNGISYEDYVSGDDDAKAAYNWAFENPEKFELSKAVASDVVEYRRYSGELNDIKADKDEDGKSITGSRKEKVLDYINGLDLDYGAKLILFKNEYNADDTYNYEIINYLNEREDISYEQMETILKELGFTVDSEGNIYWD